MTHTYALLELSSPSYDEIADKLRKASYDHAFDDNGTIDMHGIGVARDTACREISIFGIKYSLGLFQTMALGPVGTALRIHSRSADGVVTLEKIRDPDIESGWLVENGHPEPKTQYRTLNEYGMVVWTGDRDMALRFARRADAEAFSRDDEDAWSIREHFWSQPKGATISLIDEGALMHITISTTGLKAEVLERLKEPGSGGTLSDGPGVAPPNELEKKIREGISAHLKRYALDTGNVTVTCSVSLSYLSLMDNDGKEKDATPVPTDATKANASKQA